MPDGYSVNIVELAKLIQTLEDGAQQVREANKTLAAQGQLDMLGHDALKNSAHEFEEKWHYGLDKLDEAAEGVIERLQAAKKNYQELDEAHSGLFDKILSGGGGGLGPEVPGGGWIGGVGGQIGNALTGGQP